MAVTQDPYPVQFSVDYPNRPLNRLMSAFRIFTIIPIAIVLGTVAGATYSSTTGEAGRQRRRWAPVESCSSAPC